MTMSPMVVPPPAISVVVCTFNRERLLARMLGSIERQLPLDSAVEVIVVDNASTDGTAEVVRQFSGRIKNLRYAYEPRQGLSHARNRGAKEASHEHLIYLDDDAVLLDGYLMNLGTVLREHAPDLYGGPIYPDFVAPVPAWFPKRLEIRKKASVSGFSFTTTLSGGNFGVTKSVLERLGGFDPRLGMVGRKMGLIEERALIDRYRALTPIDEQKLYYIVECPILHHTPKDKLKFFYQLRRSFLGNYAHTQITLRDGGVPPSVYFSLARRRMLRGAWADLRTLFARRRKEPVPLSDWVMLAMHSALRLGDVAGALRVMLRPDKKRERSAWKGDVRDPGRVCRMLHIVDPRFADPDQPLLGRTKDIAARDEYFETRGIEVDRIYFSGKTKKLFRAAICDRNLSGYRYAIFDTTEHHWIIGDFRLTYPHIKVYVRVHHSAFLREVDLRGLLLPRLLSHPLTKLRLLISSLANDYRTAKYADRLLLSSDFEAQRYWPLIAPGHKLVPLPYFMPRDIRERIERSVRDKTALCMIVLSTERTLIEKRLAVRAIRAVKRNPHLFQDWRVVMTGNLGTAALRPRLYGPIIHVGVSNEYFSLLGCARVLIHLGDYRSGVKTRLLEGVTAGCHIIVTKRLFGRLPKDLQPYCIILPDSRKASMERVLARACHPFPETDPDGQRRRRAFRVLDELFDVRLSSDEAEEPGDEEAAPAKAAAR